MKKIGFALILMALPTSPSISRDREPKAPTAADFRPYEGEDTIDRNFSGSNVLLLREHLVRASTAAEKGDFETNAQHQARVGDLGTLLAPIDPQKFYAVPLKGGNGKYDADRQEWHITTYGGCKSYPGHETLIECLSLSVRTERPGYVGQNSYGATAVVENINYHDIKFVASKSWPKVRELFRAGLSGELGLDLTVPMQVEEARQYAGATFEVYAVGSLTAAAVRTARPLNFSPTISDPTRTQINSTTLPLLAQQLVVVVKNCPGAFAVASLTGGPLVIP